MTPDSQPEPAERQLFFRALEKATGKERAAFLDGACAGNADLRRRLEALLQQVEALSSFLEQLAVSAHDAPQKPPVTELLKDTVVAGSSSEQTGDQIGRYKLLEKIGEGGFGVVYVAEQREPIKRRVALKIIKLGMDTRQVVARFEAERQALAMMDHPNIAKVLDAGTSETGRPYFVMELVRGIPVTRYCDENMLQTHERLDLFIKICHAIQHAHQKGIIHRDLKPSNVLVTLHDGAPVPKVIDFGIAKATQGELTDKTVYTQFQQFIGTPAYMSPEQAEMSGLDIDTRSDIYSLGVLLYELLVGKTPFDSQALLASGLDEMRRRIREEEPLRPSTRLSSMVAGESTTTAKRRGADVLKLIDLLRGDLDWIVMKCLEKDRTRRYETANGLAMDVRRHLNNEPVLARAPSMGYRLQKAVRRHKLAFGAAAAIVAVLVLGLGTSSWLYLREAEAHRRVAALEREQDRLRQQAEANARKAQTAQANEAVQRQRAETQAYVANLNLAQQAWEQNNVGLLRELLAETADNPDRGFEWYFWQRLAHLEFKTLRGHLDGISSVAFSPDGRWIVTGSFDHRIKIWEAATGKELRTIEQNDQVNSVAFSADSRRIVSGSHGGTAYVWEATNGQHLLTLKGHRSEVTSAFFSPDDRRIVTGSPDQTAKVWDAASGMELFTLSGHSNAVWFVAYAADGRRIATGSWDQTAKVWDADSGKELLTLKGHKDVVLSVAFSADGHRIVTGSADQTARVWETDTGKEVVTIHGHSGDFNCVAFSPDGQRIITGGDDQSAKVWEAANGKELLSLKGHSAAVSCVAISPDGRWIITGSADRTAKLWEATKGTESPILTSRGSQLNCTAYSADLHRVITGSGNTANVWDPTNGQELLVLEGHTAPINCVAFAPDGERIATGSFDKTARVWEAATAHELLVLKGHNAQINCVAFASDGQRIITASKDYTAKVWAATNGNLLLTVRHKESVFSAAFSADGQRIATASFDQTARVWEAATGHELLALKGHNEPINCLAFASDGQRIVTGSDDRTVRVWDATSGKELLVFKGHSGPINCVAFSADGRRIVSAGMDHTVKVWQAATGKELLTLKGHTAYVQAAAFEPDGYGILSSDADGITRLWKAATAQQVAAWEADEKAASDHLAFLQQEQATAAEHEQAVRAQDPGAIREWLVLAPIPFEGGGGIGSGAVALGQEQVPHEADLQPRAGDPVTVAQRELVWSAIRLDDYLVDFNDLLGQGTPWSVAYAVCYIQSERDRTELSLNVGSDDQARIYLNGQEIYSNDASRSWVADQDVAPVRLKAGLNTLVLKVVNEESDWKASVRFSEAAGQPVKGIRVTLTPPPLAEPKAR